jgi:hypothetical protein
MALERERDIKRADDKMERENNKSHPERNPDAITGAPGSHPVGTGIGAASAGVAGVAIGTAVGGPVGSLVGGAIGAVVGAVAGGLAGKGVAEAIDPTTEDAYWRDNYSSRPYVRSGARYDDYQPAYRYGWESRRAHLGKSFDEVEPALSQNWNSRREGSPMSWDQARSATRDAWDRCDQCSGSSMASDADESSLGQDRVL